jgi:uncharacterized protein (TIGR04222 family)
MNLNPFDLRGPEFLVFYAALSTVVFFVVWLFQRFFESGSPGDEDAWAKSVAKDPYQIACLRGGRDEVIRVAVVSLVERGLLAADGDSLHTTAKDAADKVRRPLDKAIVTVFSKPHTAQFVYSDLIVRDEADTVAVVLQDMGLLPDERLASTRNAIAAIAVVLLWVVAGWKIKVALARGHHNIFFLLLMAGLVAIVAILLTKRRRTVFGNRALSYLRERFAGLDARRESLQLNGKTGEIAFLAAAFGMAALPITVATLFQPLKLRPQGRDSSGWSWGSGCSGSSCGGGGGGGGGGCGGGGCGGCG